MAVLNPQTGRRCPPARFSPGGELLNPAEAVGEFVNTAGAGPFAGYYHDAAADASRMRARPFPVKIIACRQPLVPLPLPVRAE